MAGVKLTIVNNYRAAITTGTTEIAYPLDFELSRHRERSYSCQANERVGPPFVVTRLDLKPMEACSCHKMISKEF
jgi:hypothetical protein